MTARLIRFGVGVVVCFAPAAAFAAAGNAAGSSMVLQVASLVVGLYIASGIRPLEKRVDRLEVHTGVKR